MAADCHAREGAENPGSAKNVFLLAARVDSFFFCWFGLILVWFWFLVFAVGLALHWLSQWLTRFRLCVCFLFDPAKSTLLENK